MDPQSSSQQLQQPYKELIRTVDVSSTICLYGVRYTVPDGLVRRRVRVRLHTNHFEVIGPDDRILSFWRYTVAPPRGALVVAPAQYSRSGRLNRQNRLARASEKVAKANGSNDGGDQSGT